MPDQPTPEKKPRGGARPGAGRKRDPVRQIIALAKQSSDESRIEAARTTLAEVEAQAQTEVVLAEAAATLEGHLAMHAGEIAGKLMELAKGVMVQEVDADGNPRSLYRTPPNASVLIHLANRVSGAPVSRLDLMEMLERAETKRTNAGPTRHELMDEALRVVASQVLQTLREMRSSAAPALPGDAPADAQASDGEDTVQGNAMKDGEQP